MNNGIFILGTAVGLASPYLLYGLGWAVMKLTGETDKTPESGVSYGIAALFILTLVYFFCK